MSLNKLAEKSDIDPDAGGMRNFKLSNPNNSKLATFDNEPDFHSKSLFEAR